jgi:hypothetical protein
METLCQRTPLYIFCHYFFILMFHYRSTRNEEQKSPPAESHTGARHDMKGCCPVPWRDG